MTAIGLFDSGVGGLSVLRDLLRQIPSVRCVYLADNAFAPYGERSVEAIQTRANVITHWLREQHRIDALVIACNTATAHAVDRLRQRHSDLPIIGIEPALKPAAALSATGHIGVLATRATLNSERFTALCERVRTTAPSKFHFICQPCDGLADAIERHDAPATKLLCSRYLETLWQAKPQGQQIDTVVLGCTHYPFARDVLQTACPPGVTLLDTGSAVARHTQTLLGLPDSAGADATPPVHPLFFTTGPASTLSKAVRRWLGLTLHAEQWPE